MIKITFDFTISKLVEKYFPINKVRDSKPRIQEYTYATNLSLEELTKRIESRYPPDEKSIEQISDEYGYNTFRVHLEFYTYTYFIEINRLEDLEEMFKEYSRKFKLGFEEDQEFNKYMWYITNNGENYYDD